MTEIGEKLLKDELLKLLQDEFEIYSDVPGTSDFYNKKIFADFLLFPRPHLLENGFDPYWFGVEVKHFDKTGDTGKLSRQYWQAITYKHAQFNINKNNITPKFFLCYSNFEKMNLSNEYSPFQFWMGVENTAALGKVGRFEVYPNRMFKKVNGWGIKFATSWYFTSKNSQYKRSKYNIDKVNAGNCQN
jgi:hypothetical protein